MRARSTGQTAARRLAAAILAVAAAVPSASAAGAGATRLEQPWSPGPAPVAVRDGAPAATAARVVAATSWWGGGYTTSTGERVTIRVAAAYPQDDAVAQRWADYLASLEHGSELSLVTLYLAPLAEVHQLCSPDAVGCYDGVRLVAVGDSSAGVAPTSVVAHEYGHHVAAHRRNPPWNALDWGPKRWSSTAGVCARAAAGTAYPGDEGLHYDLNPGEAFAETYRILNETRAGIAATWPILDPSFYPSPAALAAVERDVLEPWLVPTTLTVVGRFGARGPRTWSLPLSTPLDGELEVVARLPLGAAYRVSLLTPDGQLRAVGLWSRQSEQTLHFVVCGQRTLVLRVTRVGAAGRFSLRVTEP